MSHSKVALYYHTNQKNTGQTIRNILNELQNQ